MKLRDGSLVRGIGIVVFALISALATPVYSWESGFETWPSSEWFSWKGDNFSAVDSSSSGAEGWTIVCDSGDALEGRCALKSWINASQCDGSSCRSYPGMHTETAMPLLDVFWFKIDELEMETGVYGWLSLLTHATIEWDVNTMSLFGRGSDYQFEMAHLSYDVVGNPELRLGEWTRVTTYLNWGPVGDGRVVIWINGVRAFEGNSKLEGVLARAHYGAYGENLRRAVVWNDAHRICQLPEPLVDLVNEPSCPSR